MIHQGRDFTFCGFCVPLVPHPKPFFSWLRFRREDLSQALPSLEQSAKKMGNRPGVGKSWRSRVPGFGACHWLVSGWGRFVWRLPQGLFRWEIVGGSRLSPDPSVVRGELASEGWRKAGCADDCQGPVSTGLPLTAALLRAGRLGTSQAGLAQWSGCIPAVTVTT